MRNYSEQQPEFVRLLALSEELQRSSDIQLRKLDERLASSYKAENAAESGDRKGPH